ncbi:MAG TPA: tRNA pseudouridine(55) synthase TruB [Terriglobia bacterium]|nr:tRNA pseudouridine(55) synthase TruB [Terriglobia bacterium]
MVGEEISGILIIDKPAGMTSHDVVDAVRRILGLRQVGHFGTLDPFATGVLPLSLCKATRFAQFYLKSRKAYEGTIRFGVTTDTYDSTGKAAAEPVAVKLDPMQLEKLFQIFTGRILQTPPPYSAKRVGGTRAYKLARKNLPVNLAPVEVEIYALELLGVDGDSARFAVECSGGTYVRSMAHDMGQKLGCGAHLAGLRRTAVAEFTGQQAVTLEQLDLAVREGRVKDCLVPLEALLPGCPELLVRGREETNIRHGHSFQLPHALRPGRGTQGGGAMPVSLVKVMNPDRRLIAIARHVSGNVYHPELVLA